jgi:hypothetical protein
MRYPREFLVEYLGNESYIQELLSCPSLQAFLENNSLIFKDKQTLFRKLTSLIPICESEDRPLFSDSRNLMNLGHLRMYDGPKVV